jgi:hypothetical protein
MLLAVALGAPAGSEAAGRNLHGVTAAPHPTQAQLLRMAQGGARTARVHFNWRLIEPVQGVRDWSDTDVLVANAARAGVALLPYLYESPAWISSNRPTPPIYTPQAQAAWTAYLRELVGRYGNNGVFWTLHPEVPRLPIQAYQVWNEVNLRFYWGSRPNARRYAQLVRLTSAAVKGTDPAAKVILAGLLPFKTVGAGSVPGSKFLRRLYKVKKVGKLFDAISVHPYGKNPAIVMKALREARKDLNLIGARRKPMWVTEFGWTTGGELWDTSPVRAGLSQQAKWVSQTYRKMRKQAKFLRLQRALYFSFSDFDPPGTDYWNARMGLFDLAGQPKPAWFAFAQRAGGTP